MTKYKLEVPHINGEKEAEQLKEILRNVYPNLPISIIVEDD